MPVPSYDDLTPGISDVHPRDTFDQVTRIVPYDEPVVARRPVAPAIGTDDLFACLQAPGTSMPGALVSLARDFSPRIERHGEGCVVLDVSGLGRLLGDAPGIAAELARTAQARGVKVRVAIATTQVTARLLAASMLAQTAPVVALDVVEALAPLSLESLQALGPAAPRLFDAVRRWGVRTLGEFAALPADEITARFGLDGLALHRLAHGIDPRPLIADPGVPRFLESMELEWPVEQLEPLSFVLARLLDPLAQALERADRGAAALRLELRLVDKRTHARVLQLPAPMRDPRVLRTLLTLDLESHPPAAGIDVVTIEADPAPSRIVQFSLLERAMPAPETLATLTARLHALVGEDRCGSPVLLDTHRPDAFEMKRFNPDERRRVEKLPGQLVHRSAQRGGGSGSEGGSLRRFRPPVAVRVGVERSRPVQVAIDRRGMPGGRIAQAAGPWRGSGDWWNGETHWNRDEWDVAFCDGPVCRIYQDRDTQQWFLDGVFD
jgi:protein ImuB